MPGIGFEPITCSSEQAAHSKLPQTGQEKHISDQRIRAVKQVLETQYIQPQDSF